DVGYEVLSGEFEVGKPVRILRPPENSPLSIDQKQAGKIISCYVAADFASEIKWITEGIQRFIRGGLHAEDILVIGLDDRNARTYFKAISEVLSAVEIS